MNKTKLLEDLSNGRNDKMMMKSFHEYQDINFEPEN